MKGEYKSESKYTKPYPSLHLLHYSCTLVWEKYRDGALYIYFHFYILPSLWPNDSVDWVLGTHWLAILGLECFVR